MLSRAQSAEPARRRSCVVVTHCGWARGAGGGEGSVDWISARAAEDPRLGKRGPAELSFVSWERFRRLNSVCIRPCFLHIVHCRDSRSRTSYVSEWCAIPESEVRVACSCATGRDINCVPRTRGPLRHSGIWHQHLGRRRLKPRVSVIARS